jgi:hypothetical protein
MEYRRPQKANSQKDRHGENHTSFLGPLGMENRLAKKTQIHKGYTRVDAVTLVPSTPRKPYEASLTPSVATVAIGICSQIFAPSSGPSWEQGPIAITLSTPTPFVGLQLMPM